MAKKSKTSRKTTAQRLAITGLWVSLVGLLAVIILLVLKLLIYMGMYTPPNMKYINLALWISIGVLIIGPALYTLLAPQRVREFLGGRQARHGSNAVILLIAFILILVVVNMIVFQNPTQWDWTEDKKNTLAPETLNTLAAIPSSVQAIAFYTSRSSSTATDELLSNYKDNSDGKFDYKIVDPEQNPVLAQQYGVTGDSTVVLAMDSRHETLSYITEQELTNALVRLMNPGERTVYFLTGHGEYDITSSGDQGYSTARSVLEAKNYTVQTLNLRAENKIPQDALAIIIAGPTEPISAEEMPLLMDFVNNGGALIVLTEPLTTSVESDPLAQYLATDWGVTLGNDLIVDTSSSQAWVAVASSYATHSITQKLENVITFFPTARSLGLSSGIQNIQVAPLILSSDAAWGETDFTSIQNDQVSYDAATDISGPLTLAAAAENSATNSRLVVVCDSDFASDTSFNSYGNGDLFINSIDWAAGQENMISLTAKAPVTRQMNIPGSATILLLAFSFICLIPGLILGAGITAWFIRRSRG